MTTILQLVEGLNKHEMAGAFFDQHIVSGRFTVCLSQRSAEALLRYFRRQNRLNAFMNALIEAGLDNWEGYDEAVAAMDNYHD